MITDAVVFAFSFKDNVLEVVNNAVFDLIAILKKMAENSSYTHIGSACLLKCLEQIVVTSLIKDQ